MDIAPSPSSFQRRFWPLLVAQWLGAFQDNLFKSAFVVALLYSPDFKTGMAPSVLTTLAAGVFILPFVIFSPLGGQLADRFSRSLVIQRVKIFEILIALLGFATFLSASVPLGFITLFCFGMHSAIFGPSRYAILPDILDEDELIDGNAQLNMAIFMAILGGTIAGTLSLTLPHGLIMTGGTMMLCACAGYVASLFLPRLSPARTGQRLDYNFPVQFYKTMARTFRESGDIVFAVLGVGWFCFLGAMFMAQFANYTALTLHAAETVLTFFLTMFSIGVAAGSLLSAALLKGQIRTRLVPLALTGISLFSCDLYFADAGFSRSSVVSLLSLEDFLHQPAAWRIIADFFLIALFGGLFEVPLNTLLQHRTREADRASVLAGSALVNALFVVASSVLCALILAAGWDIPHLFLTFGLSNAAITLLVWGLVMARRMPD